MITSRNAKFPERFRIKVAEKLYRIIEDRNFPIFPDRMAWELSLSELLLQCGLESIKDA